MSKKMLINASHPEENRVAIVVDGILSELDIEIAGQEQTKGNIYKAVVTRVESGLQAAFVDYGAEKMGFLQIGEIHPNIYPATDNPDTKNRPRINDILQRGQELLVQIVKEERGTKGAALTTFLSLPGRYMVLMPDSKTKGVSRKITEESERKQLKRTMAELDLPERMGYIVRTAGIGKEQEELKRDFDYLVSLYQGIENRKEQVKAPAQLYQESNLVIRSIRDYFSNEIDEVLIDDSRIYQEAKDFFSLVMPEQIGLVKQHRERRPVFSRFQIEEQIDALGRNQIPLPSGGSIVIDQTEALVAIDVNSGKMSSENGIEATAGKTNLEAAVEVGRQLRLRDLGGLIVIDFIDMRDRKRIREVEHTVRASLRDDKAKVTVGRISQFGLLEMSRQRIKAALSVGAYLDCPHCQGKGRIKSIETQAVAFLRQAHAAASKGHIGTIEARTPLDVANYLLNEKRSALGDLEKQLNLKISIEGRPEFVPGQVELELHKREKQPEQAQPAAPISHANQIEDALAAAANQETSATQTAGPTDTNESGETVPENGEESTGRKRRRRRRKRGGRREDEDKQTASTAADDAATDDKQPIEASETVPAEPAENIAKDETTTDVAKPTRPRSRGRRGTKKPASAETQEALNETAAENKAEEKNQTDTVSTVPDAPADEKPKRQRTRKPATKKAPAETAPETQQAQPVDSQEKTDKTEPADKPKRRAPRRPAAKKQQAEQPVGTVEAVATEPPAATEENKAAGEKPKRRPGRKATKPKPAESQSTKTTAEQPAVADQVKAEEKPKKRAPARKSVKKDSAPTTVTETKEAQIPTAETADKPQRRSRKKAPAKAETPVVESTASSAAEKPKRRSTKKPAVPKKETTANAAEPKTEAAVAVEKTPADKKPKRATPRKAPAKKAAKPEVKATEQSKATEVVEKTATEAKPKRRAPRKKAPVKVEGPTTAE